MHGPKTLRTVILLVVASSLLLMGLLNIMQKDGDMSLGPVAPVAPLLPSFPSDSDFHLMFPVAGTVNGLSTHQLGMPYRVAAGNGRVYIADAFAISGIIRAYNIRGMHQVSFGTLGKEDLSFVVDTHFSEDGNLVVLDSTPAIHIFSPNGDHLRRIDIVSGSSDPELAWAKAIVARQGEYYVLCLGSLLRIDGSGKIQDVYPRRTDSYSFATAASEFYLGPSGLASSQEGLWIADSVNGRLLLLSWTGVYLGEIQLPGSLAGMQSYPTSIQVDSDGVIYVIDAAHLRIMALDNDGQMLWQEGLSATLPESHPEEIYDIALISKGVLSVSDSLSRRVELWEVSSEGVSSRKELVSSEAAFLFPSEVVVDGEDIYILCGEGSLNDNVGYAIYKSNLSGGTSLLTSSWEGEPFEAPGAMAIHGEHLYLLDSGRILVFGLDGSEVAVWGDDLTDWGGFSFVTLFGEVLGPSGLAVSSRGEIYVSDTFGHRIVVFSSKGDYHHQILFSTDVRPTAIQFAPDNTLVVLDPYQGQVVRVAASGEVLGIIGSAGSEAGQLGVISDLGRFDGPRGLGVDDDGSIYVVDTYNARILKFSPTGEYLGFGGLFGSKSGEVYLPSGLFIDKLRGLLYLADTYNHRIQLMILPR